MDYKKIAALMSADARKIFLLFESEILREKNQIEHCPLGIIPDDAVFESDTKWIFEAKTTACKLLCHFVWGYRLNTEAWCPCNRFGKEKAYKRLQRLCNAIREVIKDGVYPEDW